jgi:phosphate acetyltransferase
VGSDFDDGQPGARGIPRELAFNARMATEFGSVVVVVVNGATAEAAALDGEARAAYHSLTDLDATVAAVVVNRAPDGPAPARAARARPTSSPRWRRCGAPTVAEVAHALRATVVTGDGAALGRDVLDFVVGAAQVPTVLDHLTPGALLIAPGDRADLLVATAAAQVAGTASVAGIVLTLGIDPDPVAMRVFEGLDPGLAVLKVATASYETIAASTRIEHALSVANPRKVEAALGAFESSVDGAELSRQLDVSRSTRVTPMMFEHELIDRARADRRRLGPARGHRRPDPARRRHRAARGVADLVLLGDPTPSGGAARDLGLDLAAAEVIDPGRERPARRVRGHRTPSCAGPGA